jgi:hypothetical protein
MSTHLPQNARNELVDDDLNRINPGNAVLRGGTWPVSESFHSPAYPSEFSEKKGFIPTDGQAIPRMTDRI